MGNTLRPAQATETMAGTPAHDETLRALRALMTLPESDRKVEGLVRDAMVEIARTGCVRFTWDVTRPAMVALMRASMKEFARAQRSVGAKVDVGPPRAEDAAAADAAERLANELAQFPAPPFTSQRLCELLLAPREYYTKIEKLVHAVEKLMTVTGTVASSNAPPDEPDDVDVNPARVRHEKDPVNLEQTAFVSSLVGTATGPATATGPGPGPGGDHPVATNGVGARVDAGGTSTETDAGDAGPGPIGDANGSIVGSVLAGKRKAEGDPCSADGGVDGVAVDGGVAGPAVDAGGAPSVSAVES